MLCMHINFDRAMRSCWTVKSSSCVPQSSDQKRLTSNSTATMIECEYFYPTPKSTMRRTTTSRDYW